MWCSGAIQIRTTFSVYHVLQIRKRNGFCAFFVKRQNQLVVIQKDRVDEGINEHFAMAFLPHVQLAEAMQPEGHELGIDFRLRQLLAGEFRFQIVASGFQLFQPLLRRARQDTLLDGVEQIIDGGFRLAELLLVKRYVHVVAFLQIHEHGHDSFNSFVVHHHFHGFGDDQIFNPFFPDGLFVTLRALLLDGHTFVVVVNHTRAARPAFAAEVRAAAAAEQFGS